MINDLTEMKRTLSTRLMLIRLSPERHVSELLMLSDFCGEKRGKKHAVKGIIKSNLL